MRKNRIKAFSLIELSIVILIIGILVAGITQASRLVMQMRLNTARAITQSAPVSSVRNLVLWYETTSDASFDDADEQDTSLVSNWYDINSVAISKVNASSSSSARPSYKANCINNLPCLSFDGSNDYMDTASLGVTSTAMTYFMVLNPTTISTSAFTSFIMTNGAYSAGNNSVHFQIRNGGDQDKFQFAAVNGAQDAISSAALVANKAYILGAVDNASNVTLYKNAASAASVSSASAAKTLGVMNIASYNDSSRARFFTGYIAEIIIFDRALKTEERQSIESYLSKKWGIKI